MHCSGMAVASQKVEILYFFFLIIVNKSLENAEMDNEFILPARSVCKPRLDIAYFSVP